MHGAILNKIKNWAPNAPMSLHPAIQNLTGQYIESAIMAATKDCVMLAPDMLQLEYESIDTTLDVATRGKLSEEQAIQILIGLVGVNVMIIAHHMYIPAMTLNDIGIIWGPTRP